jgi:hypothetical protein
MAEHITILRKTGQAVREPVTDTDATILGLPTA